MADKQPVAEFAPAKINLTLHVTGQRPDGYHLLDSLVVFADVGDRLTIAPSDTPVLTVTGPRAEGVPGDASNLALRAAALTGTTVRIALDKHLPAAAGIGGGSADAAAASEARQVSPNVVWEGLNIPREEREAAQGHQAAVLWFTGLSGSGKTTVAREVERRLFDSGIKTMLLDGDQVRHGLNGDLGFSAGDRRENVRRIGEVARLFFESGAVTLCTFVSPYRTDRDRVRALVPEGRFIEIHVDVDVETAQERDPKGIYAKAQAGEITNLTGIDAPYEAPEAPELTLKTADQSVQDAVEAVLAALAEAGIVERGA